VSPCSGEQLSTRIHRLACRREGVTGIEVAVEALTTSFVVNCRFAQRIAGESYLELERGDPSQREQWAHARDRAGIREDRDEPLSV
jgi:hypothetical protein